jgi:hypothetical protein
MRGRLSLLEVLRQLICHIIGHCETREGYRRLHFVDIVPDKWITPQTPCYTSCYRCGEPLRWIVPEHFFAGTIDQVRITKGEKT